jgi:hypothetical protein
LKYFSALWYNLWPFVVILVHFSRFGRFGPRKIWQTCQRLGLTAKKTKLPKDNFSIQMMTPQGYLLSALQTTA